MDNQVKNDFYSSKYDLSQESGLRSRLDKDGFIFKQMEHAIWRAQNSEVNVTLYRSGKILIQGRGTNSFLNKYIEHATIQQTILPTHSRDDKQTNAKHMKYSSWIGTDESGKGDYFGPLVIAGVLVDENNIQIFKNLDVKDSKKLSDENIEKIARQIKAKRTFSIITINPAKYNQLYTKFKNLNNLLAWGHARAIENILEKKECKNAISDKFGNEKLIKDALMTQGKTINLEQRVRAEDDIAVAAASILARAEFVQRIKKLSNEYGINLPKGASGKIKEQARVFVQKYGFDALTNIAKLHFKTSKEI